MMNVRPGATRAPNASTPSISSVPLLDVNLGNQPVLEEILFAIESICKSGRFVGGTACSDFENAMADFCQTDFAVGCASGSDALLLALMAIDVGVGDEVLLPSFTFFATASAVWRLGAKPVFVDIDPSSFNLDANKIEAAITKRTKAIIPVHLFGQCADMTAILEIADRHGLRVIEDAAQAVGSEYLGERAGSIGDIGCFSFYPTKNLGGFGDGGMLTTQNEALATRLRKLANHGMAVRYYHDEVGVNSRLDAIQAVALNAKIKLVESWASGRAINADRYDKLFSSSMACQYLQTPKRDSRCHHVWNQYTIRVPGIRDALRSQLTECKIGTEIYYPVPLHLQECFKSLGYREGSLPHTEQASREVLSLPIFPELTIDQQEHVVASIERCIETMPGQYRAAG